MKNEVHPLSGATYTELGDGKVRVEKADKYGVFDWEGRHIEGDLQYADPHLLQWVGGPELPPRPAKKREQPEAEKSEAGDPGIIRRGGKRPRSTLDNAMAAEASYAGGIPKDGVIDETFTRYTGDPGRDTPDGPRSTGISFAELLELDQYPERIPDTLRRERSQPGGVRKVPTERYFARKWHDLEVERLWKRVWQMACHVDDIPEIGDYIVYDVAQLSWIVVRTGADEFKAYNNACLHRGRQLREFDGKQATEFRCPFHGWCWELDGSLREIPSEWDFPEVREDVGQLPEAKTATWGGFVFINPDPDCEPFEDFLGSLPAHYEKYDYETKHKQMHVAKVVRANWKTNQEAFMEGYHIIATHPQLMIYSGDGANHQYDSFDNWSRAVTLAVSTSPHRNMHPSREELSKSRNQMANMMRESLREVIGDRVDIYCDAELIDGQYNNLFPNFHPWGTFSRIVYRFRPYGDDPDMSIMEVMYLAPWPLDKPKPPAAPIHWLGPDDHWTDAPEMGALARVLNQDSYNLPKIQKGLKAKVNPYIYLAAYEEGKIRHFHHLYDQWVAYDEG